MRLSRPLAAALGGTAAYAAYRTAATLRRRASFDGARVLILGGGRGLGLDLARVLAGQGASLALVARSGDQLATARAELAGRGATTVVRALDLRPEGAAAEAVRWAAEALGGLDAVVYVAGIIQVGPLEHLARKDYEDALALHFWAPREALDAALPHLRRSRIARAVVVSSIAGRVAVPHLLPYSASKFALSGLADGLRAAFRRQGVYLTTVNPGLMRTGSPRNAAFKGRHDAEYAWFAAGASTPLTAMASDRAARQIVEAARRGRARFTVTLQARLLTLADALLPEAVADAMALVERTLPAPTGPAGDRLTMGHEGPEDAAPAAITRRIAAAAARANEADAPRP